jgi:hypothetical protein
MRAAPDAGSAPDRRGALLQGQHRRARPPSPMRQTDIDKSIARLIRAAIVPSIRPRRDTVDGSASGARAGQRMPRPAPSALRRVGHGRACRMTGARVRCNGTQRRDMPTSWKRADDNALRAHLQEALAERLATADAADWSYSDDEVEALRAELDERQVLHAAARREDEPAAASPLADPPGAESQLAIAEDVERLRVLIARCFRSTRRPHAPPPRPPDDGSPRAPAAPAVAASGVGAPAVDRCRRARGGRQTPPANSHHDGDGLAGDMKMRRMKARSPATCGTGLRLLP